LVEIWLRLFGHGLFVHVHYNAKFCKQEVHKLLKNLGSQKRYMKQVPY